MSTPTVSFNGSTFTAVGMARTFSVTPQPQKIKHYATNQGTKLLDKIAFISLEASVDLTLDEFIEDNLVMALLGEVISAGEISIGNGTTIERQLLFNGTNTFGPNLQVWLPHVFFSCDKVIELISDADWGKLDLTGDVLLKNGSFGTIGFLTSPSTAPLSPDNTSNYYVGKGQVYTAPLGA